MKKKSIPNQDEVAMVLAVGAAADLGSRIFLAVISLFIKIKSRYMVLGAASALIVSRFSGF